MKVDVKLRSRGRKLLLFVENRELGIPGLWAEITPSSAQDWKAFKLKDISKHESDLPESKSSILFTV